MKKVIRSVKEKKGASECKGVLQVRLYRLNPCSNGIWSLTT